MSCGGSKFTLFGSGGTLGHSHIVWTVITCPATPPQLRHLQSRLPSPDLRTLSPGCPTRLASKPPQIRTLSPSVAQFETYFRDAARRELERPNTHPTTTSALMDGRTSGWYSVLCRALPPSSPLCGVAYLCSETGFRAVIVHQYWA